MLNVENEERFWRKVDKEGALPPVDPFLGRCWEWLGGRGPTGYGIFCLGASSMRAHRYSWLLSGGTIPQNQELHHQCLNRGCMNPAHMEIVTHAVHMAKMRKTYCWRGHAMSGDNIRLKNDGDRVCRKCHLIRERLRRSHLPRRNKLTPEQVKEIQAWGKTREVTYCSSRGPDTITAKAAKYGVRRCAIQRILSGEGWKSLGLYIV